MMAETHGGPERAGEAATWRTRRGSALALVTVAVVATAGCGPDASRAADRGASADGDSTSNARVVNVEVRDVARERFTERIRVTGTVSARRDVELAAEESGRIREVVAEEGSRVRAGEVLVRLDDDILRAELEQAEAREELARETFERNRQLFEEDRAISELRFVETRARAREATAARKALQERVERAVVRAPFDGVLETRYVEIGARVAPGDPVGRLVQLDPVEISGGVPERYAPDLRVGSPVTVRFDVLPGRTYDGRLSYVGSVIHPESRTFRVELVLPNPDDAVKPEMVADLTLVRRELDAAIVVSQETLVREEEGFVAFVVEAGERGPVARARPVDVRTTQRNRAVIEDGLAAGDRLVVVGQARLADGDRVRVVGERSPAGEDRRAEGSVR